MRLKDMLEDSGTTDQVKKVLRGLPEDGKKAIDNFFDYTSAYNMHGSKDRFLEKLSFLPNEDRILYHYTTVDSVKAILKSRTWFIKQKGFMNDHKELFYTIELVKTILTELKATPDEINVFDKIFKTTPIGDTYIWSFTENKASQTLFGNYSVNSNGIALGLNSSQIEKELFTHFSHGKDSSEFFTNGDAYSFALKVVYDEKIQRESLEPIVKEWMLAYRGLKAMPKDREVILTNCLTTISFFALCFKNPLLRQEEEIRFVITYNGEVNKNYSEKTIDGVPYVTCEVSDFLIREAIIQTGSSITVSRFKNELREYGFGSIRVSESELPY